MKRLDEKLERVRNGTYKPADFIIADAKDGDMGFGLTAPGPRPGGGFKSRAEYLQNVCDASVDARRTVRQIASHSQRFIK